MSKSSNKMLRRPRFARIYKAAGGKCAYCRRKLTPDEGTEDHVVPLSKGGVNNIRNVVLSCAPCNESKGDSVWHVPVRFRDRRRPERRYR